MWILIRLVVAAIGFALRFRAGKDPPHVSGSVRETPYFAHIRKKNGRTIGFSIGMERPTPAWARLHAESRTDRAFKALGIANERETGDRAFDSRVYVTCDHSYVSSVLAVTPGLRQAIVAMLDAGYRNITFDGATVWADRTGRDNPSELDLEMLHAVWGASAALSDPPPNLATDRFAVKALVVESAIWGIATYAMGGLVEAVFVEADVHASHAQLLTTAAYVALAAFVGLFLTIVLWLRGSSRGHRVIVESAIVLIVALPFASLLLLSDTNRALDRSAVTVADRAHTGCETRKTRSRRGVTTSYYLMLAPASEVGGPALPDEIQIVESLCHAASAGERVQIGLGQGRWGLQWYRWIRIGDETWRS